jgi:CubicO group peptidase (beta-lactamase class C family)
VRNQLLGRLIFMNLTARLDRVIDAAIDGGEIAGGVVMVARHGDIAYSRPAGYFDREAGAPMREDAIFRLASCTKPIVAATALAMSERGLLRLHHPVADYLAEFRPLMPDGNPAQVTIRHLLTHTSGLTYDNPAVADAGIGLTATDVGLEELVRRLGAATLAFEPGTQWAYGTSIDVLGAVIAAVHGSTLSAAVAQYVTEPLGMSDTGFSVSDRSRLAPAYADGPPGLRPMSDDEQVTGPDGSVMRFSPQRIFSTAAFESGGAGMAGSAPDFLRFLETLRRGGEPILQPETIAEAFQTQIGALPRPAHNAGRGFGYFGEVIEDTAVAHTPQSAGTVRWGGAYGHEWFIDPANALAVVSFTNTALGGSDGPFPKRIRDAVYDAVAGS